MAIDCHLDWREVACISDYGLKLDAGYTAVEPSRWLSR
jgi:hypothetical protein